MEGKILKFKKSLTIPWFIIIFISGCVQLPKPDYSKNRTTLVIPLEIVNNNMSTTFKIHIKSNENNLYYRNN